MRSGSDQRPFGRYNRNRPYQQDQRPLQRNQPFDSHGPDVKIRGTAHQIFERYVALAREAMTVGDRVASENLYQHAEHYFRIDSASREGMRPGAPSPIAPADASMPRPEQRSGETEVEPTPLGFGDEAPGFI